MSYGILDTIMDELKEEMENKIVGSQDYYTSPYIERGIHTWDDAQGRFPFIWFILSDDAPEEYFGNNVVGTAVVELHGYAETGADGNSENMHKLLRDVKRFLTVDYTRLDSVIIGNTALYEGGISDTMMMSGFMMTINISYTTTVSAW